MKTRLKWTEGTFLRRTTDGEIEQNALLSETVFSKYGRRQIRAAVFSEDDEWIEEVHSLDENGAVRGIVSNTTRSTRAAIIEAAEEDVGMLSGAIRI